MKNVFRPAILPWFTLACGGLGLGLRIWLFQGMDEKGLLPAGHVASVFIFVLTALVLLTLFLCVRPLRPMSKYSRLFPAGIRRAVGCAAGAAGVVCAGVYQYAGNVGLLGSLTLALAIVSGVCLLVMAWLRLQGRRPSFWLHTVPTVFLMLYTVCRCRVWGSEPQLQMYFFQLLASVFLMLTSYYLSVLDTQKGSRQWLVFFSQAALFCCCLCLNGEHMLFYLGMILWLTLDMCSVTVKSAPVNPQQQET